MIGVPVLVVLIEWDLPRWTFAIHGTKEIVDGGFEADNLAEASKKAHAAVRGLCDGDVSVDWKEVKPRQWVGDVVIEIDLRHR
jgi:hypothetical protein